MTEENFLGEAKFEYCSYHTALKENIEQLPYCLTAIKKKYILDQASVNTRFVLLCLGSLSVAAITARFSPSFIKVTRNTVITYLASGLFVVPEKVNHYYMNIIKLVAIIAVVLLGLLYSLLQYYISFLAVMPTLALIYWLAKQSCMLMTFPASSKLYYKFVLTNMSHYLARRMLSKCSIIMNGQNHGQQEALLYLQQQYQIFAQMDRKTSLQIQCQHLLSETITNKHIKPLMNFLEKYIDNQTNFQLSEFLGTLKERRLYILLTNPKAHRLIIKNGTISLDVLHLQHSPDSPAVLYCHPNAGFYEYAYQDCDWFKFYRTLNYNIITWNYRSFGYSEGKASPQNCINDAEYLVDYFRSEFGYQIFGVHGHSLGGMVASEVAYSKNMSFLIADRTFSSLGQVASKMMGTSAARFVFQLVTGWDKPNYLKYYNYSGPKLIIQDASDEMIPYTSQLQTAIVRCYFTGIQEPSFISKLLDRESDSYMKFFYSRIINQVEMEKLCQNLEYIIKIIAKESQQNNQYVELDQDKLFIQDIEEIFRNIRYNGNDLFRVLIESRSNMKETVALFFGSCFTFENNFLQDYRVFEKEISKLLPCSLSMQLNEIYQIIGKIVDKFETNDNINVGELLAVFCGHNNNLTQFEFTRVAHFLGKNNLIIQ